MERQMTEKWLFTIPELCGVTGFSRSFLYERISAGELRAVKIHRTVRVAAEDLKVWIDRERAGSTQPEA